MAELAHYIAQKALNIKGLSDKNLWCLKQFYETYQADEKLATLWRELSWSHNRLIMTLKNKEERLFYLVWQLRKDSVCENWNVKSIRPILNAAL